MSEVEQDALLDRIETHRRRKAIGARTISLLACAVALALVALLIGP
jgi:hypothetical protein